jgi:predicted metal-dependent peptidase
LENVNNQYNLKLEPYETFEYYVENIQTMLDLQDYDEDGEENDKTSSEDMDNNIQMDFNPENTHDIWNESDNIDQKTLKEFTEKFIDNSQKGTTPDYLGKLIASLKNSKGELPWNVYLKKLMGTVESNKKKTITRRNRRQPNRLDLRGELRGHKAEIAVAIDISGSISNEEFKQAIKEVLNIVKTHSQEITIIECDSEIRRAYNVRSPKDIQDRFKKRGATKFSPVFEYANEKKINLLVYFTDGKGENKLRVLPKGYKILWVISGRGDKLSLKEPYGAIKKLSKVKVKEESFDMSDVREDGYSMNNQAPML